jgi:hypothetical protein
MKKALASIVLLASSAGVFALPAAAHERDDRRVANNSYYSYSRGDRDHDRRDYRRSDRRDYRYHRNFWWGR